jgi:predicted  nucleic acid-binding Zn-ribbon protein
VALPAASMDAIAKRIRLAHNELVSAQAAYARLQEDWSRAQQSYEEERRQVVAGMAEIAERERGLQEQLAEIVREHGMLVTVPINREGE